MTTTIKSFIAAAAVAAAMAVPTFSAAEDLSAQAGYLRCDVAGSVSFIFGSSRDMTCAYEPAEGGAVQTYTGTIERYGVDIGYSERAVMLWGVATAGAAVPDGGLAGHYAGVSADVAAGYGVGVNVLVLGDESVALQPLSVQGGEGLNVALGIAALTLEAN